NITTPITTAPSTSSTFPSFTTPTSTTSSSSSSVNVGLPSSTTDAQNNSGGSTTSTATIIITAVSIGLVTLAISALITFCVRKRLRLLRSSKRNTDFFDDFNPSSNSIFDINRKHDGYSDGKGKRFSSIFEKNTTSRINNTDRDVSNNTLATTPRKILRSNGRHNGNDYDQPYQNPAYKQQPFNPPYYYHHQQFLPRPPPIPNNLYNYPPPSHPYTNSSSYDLINNNVGLNRVPLSPNQENRNFVNSNNSNNASGSQLNYNSYSNLNVLANYFNDKPTKNGNKSIKEKNDLNSDDGNKNKSRLASRKLNRVSF
ncbi:11939_t:CDS:2, partial [Entrophospora sp. SA101]